MNARTITLLLAGVSALGIAYFAVDMLLGLGDLEWIATTEPKILIVALIVTLVPILIAWGGTWWIYKAENIKLFILKIASLHMVAWAWLFFGSIYLALMRFQ